jgi:hypothetical protein
MTKLGMFLCCGLGNKLNNIITTIYISKIKNIPTIYYYNNIDNHFDEPIENIINFEKIANHFQIRFIPCSSQQDFYNTIGQCLYTSAYTGSKWHHWENWNHPTNIINTTFMIYDFMGMEHIYNIFRNIFFQDHIYEKYNNEYKKYLEQCDSIFHIRRGDIRIDINNALPFIEKEISTKKRVLLLTDDPIIKRDFKKYENVITTESPLPVFDKTIYRSRHTMYASVCELLLMINGPVDVFCSYSTFSYLGSLKHLYEKKKLIDIKNYV